MKQKLLLVVSILSFIGCGDIYTIKNEMVELIRAGSQKVQPNECLELSEDSSFGLFGDFPLTITKEDGSALSDNVDKNKPYEAGHYVVTVEGEVIPKEEACKEGDSPNQKTVKDNHHSKGAANEETSPPLETPVEDNSNKDQQPEETEEENSSSWIWDWIPGLQ